MLLNQNRKLHGSCRSDHEKQHLTFTRKSLLAQANEHVLTDVAVRKWMKMFHPPFVHSFISLQHFIQSMPLLAISWVKIIKPIYSSVELIRLRFTTQPKSLVFTVIWNHKIATLKYSVWKIFSTILLIVLQIIYTIAFTNYFSCYCFYQITIYIW